MCHRGGVRINGPFSCWLWPFRDWSWLQQELAACILPNVTSVFPDFICSRVGFKLGLSRGAHAAPFAHADNVPEVICSIAACMLHCIISQ